VLIGGDYQGGNTEVQNAARTYVGPDVEIRADATVSGDGGKVVLWADGDTRYYGSISARGGAKAGDGGLVEVSGKQYLDFHGTVDVSAPSGAGGKVLLDPQDILLNTTLQAAPPNNATGTPDVAFADPPDPGTYTIEIADVTGYAELFLQATRDITVANAITMGAGNSIRFEANNNITVNAGATVTTSGTPTLPARPSITLTADADGLGGGAVTLNAGLVSQQGGILISGASVTGAAAGTITTTGPANQNAGSVTINSTGAVNLAGAITANGGAGGAGLPGGAGGLVTITGTGAITTAAITANGGNAGAGGAVGGAAGVISVTNNSLVAGNVTLGALTARSGDTTGAAAGGAAGSITVVQNNATAGATLSTLGIDTRGGIKGAGGAVLLDSDSNVTVTGTIQTTGGTPVAAGTHAGTAGGNLTITGVDRSVTGAITASGGAAVGVNQAGGNAGVVSITGTRTLNTVAITSAVGSATGTGASGVAGSITASGTTVTTTALNTAGAALGNGNGGAISVTSTTGALTINGAVNSSAGTVNAGVAGRNAGTITLASAGALTGAGLTLTASGSAGSGAGFAGGNGAAISATSTGGNVTVGAISATGGNAGGGIADGGNGGAVALDAGGATPTITHANITTTGGDQAGGGTAGAGGSITVADAARLSANTVITATGGSAGLGAGGNVQFSGTLDSSGVSRTLAVNTNGTTIFDGAVGSALALSTLTTDAAGGTQLNANVSSTGAQTYNDALTVGGAGATLSAGAGNVTFAGTVNGPQALTVNTTGTTTFTGAVGGVTALASLTTNAGGTTVINGGAVTTTGAQTYGDSLTTGGATTLRTTSGGSVSGSGAVTATAGTLTFDTGAGDVTFGNASNDFGTVAITSGGAVVLVDSNALTISGATTVGTLQAQTLTGNLTVSGAINATGGGDSIVLAAAADFVNSVGPGALNPGSGRWLVYSTSPAGSTENGLTGVAGSALPRLYNRTFGGNPPASITEPGNHLIYSAQPALTVTPDDKSKVYGVNDPAQTYVAVGFVTDDSVTDTVLTADLTGSFGRVIGESVGTRLITQSTFTSDAGYSITFDGTKTLTITQVPLSFALATPAQTKPYGTNDPAVGGLGVTLSGLVTNPAIVTWNGPASVTDGAVTGTLTGLTRTAGENVGTYAALTGAVTLSASDGNYLKSFDTSNSPQLSITQVPLAATIANQAKTYGAADPALPGIAVALAGVVNNPAIVTWNGNVAVNDTASVTASLATLTRVAGETVAAPGPTYAFTGGTLNPLAGPAAGNYTAALSVAGNTLTINPAALSIRADDTSRPIGAPNPAFTATYSGLQFADTPASLAGALAFSTTATIGSPGGPYPVNPSGQASPNYTITYLPGILTVGNPIISTIDPLKNTQGWLLSPNSDGGVDQPFLRPLPPTCTGYFGPMAALLCIRVDDMTPLGSAHRNPHLPYALDRREHDVARPHRAHALRRPGEEHVPGLERVERARELDQLGNAEDQVPGVRPLARLASYR